MELLNVVIGEGFVKVVFGCLLAYTLFRVIVVPILVVMKDILVAGLGMLKEILLFAKGFFRGMNDRKSESKKIQVC